MDASPTTTADSTQDTENLIVMATPVLAAGYVGLGVEVEAPPDVRAATPRAFHNRDASCTRALFDILHHSSEAVTRVVVTDALQRYL